MLKLSFISLLFIAPIIFCEFISSFLLLCKDKECDYLYKIRILKQAKAALLKGLDILGFRASTIFPDAEHIALEQNAHFENGEL